MIVYRAPMDGFVLSMAVLILTLFGFIIVAMLTDRASRSVVSKTAEGAIVVSPERREDVVARAQERMGA